MKLPEIGENFNPNRVVINIEGEATTSFCARRDHAINPDIIFCRLDGWMLGAPKHLELIAWRMWKNDWIAFIRKPDVQWRPIIEYLASRKEKD